jgi:hypothetical protein
MRLWVIAWVSILAATSQASAREAPGASLFPLELGAKWTYSVAGQKSELVVTAARKEKVGDVECTVLESAIDGKVVATEHVAVVGAFVKRFRLADVEIAPPLAFVKTDLRRGDNWDADFSVLLNAKKVDTKIAFVANTDRVKVPAGEYDAIVLAGATQQGTTKVWYARGIGPVRIVFDFGNGAKGSMELKSATFQK